MKKILLTLSVLLILVGCGTGASTNLNDASEVIITVGDVEINKGSIYTMMKNQDIAAIVVDLAKETLITSMVEVDDDINTRADELLEENKAYFGDYWETFIESNYESEQDFRDSELVVAAQQEQLARNYFDTNFEKIVEDQQPKYVRILGADTLDDANAIIDGLKNGEDVDDLNDEYGVPNSSSDPTVIASTSSLPEELLEFVLAGSKGDLFDTPVKDDTNNIYYMAQIVEDDVEEYREDFFRVYVTSANNLDTVFSYYFEEKNFKIHDQDIYDLVTSNPDLEPFYPN